MQLHPIDLQKKSHGISPCQTCHVKLAMAKALPWNPPRARSRKCSRADSHRNSRSNSVGAATDLSTAGPRRTCFFGGNGDSCGKETFFIGKKERNKFWWSLFHSFTAQLYVKFPVSADGNHRWMFEQNMTFQFGVGRMETKSYPWKMVKKPAQLYWIQPPRRRQILANTPDFLGYWPPSCSAT